MKWSSVIRSDQEANCLLDGIQLGDSYLHKFYKKIKLHKMEAKKIFNILSAIARQ
jgi:hypothetical protein